MKQISKTKTPKTQKQGQTPVDWWKPSSRSLCSVVGVSVAVLSVPDGPVTHSCRLMKTQLSFTLLCSVQWRQHCRLERPSWSRRHAPVDKNTAPLVPFSVQRAVAAALPSWASLDPLSQAPARPFGINQALVPFIEQHAGRQHCRLVPCTHNRALRSTPTILWEIIE